MIEPCLSENNAFCASRYKYYFFAYDIWIVYVILRHWRVIFLPWKRVLKMSIVLVFIVVSSKWQNNDILFWFSNDVIKGISILNIGFCIRKLSEDSNIFEAEWGILFCLSDITTFVLSIGLKWLNLQTVWCYPNINIPWT